MKLIAQTALARLDHTAKLKRRGWVIPALLLAITCAPPPAEMPETATAEVPAPPPGTEIFLLALTHTGDTVSLGPPRNISNHPGYDNQPWFSPDGATIYFSSNRAGGETDVYRYTLADGTIKVVLESPTAEYSPTLAGGDPESLTVVRVEESGAQRLWRVNGPNPRPLIAGIDSVGYYAWAGLEAVVMFVVGEPHSLQHANLQTGAITWLADNIGRTLKSLPDGSAVSFVDKRGSGWWIMTVDNATLEIRPVAGTLPEREDYAWLPDGRMILSGSNGLYLHTGDGWQELVTFDDPALQGITRLAISPDGNWLALVSAEPAGP